MKIAIFGLGYVGCVSTACFAREGHHVIGVDINPDKVRSIHQGISPIVEPGLGDLLLEGVKAGRIEATMDIAHALDETDIAMICVGTPSHDNGGLNLGYVERVCEDIGAALKENDRYITVAVRSTMLPGSTSETLVPVLEKTSGRKAGEGFGFGVNPEFLREGTALKDFDHPPYTIVGELDQKSGDMISALYEGLDAPLFRVPLGVSEMVKYASNAFHALKVTFANEIGNISQRYNIDSHQVMDIFVQDTKLNLSPYYLKPGFAFGGSCLGKDVRALLYAGRQKDIKTPVLEAILPSNELQVQKALNMLVKENKKNIGIIGLSFKPQTDDLRESPSVELAERLLGKGFNLKIYDNEVTVSKIHGSNREFIERIFPHLNSLMSTSFEETVSTSEAIVVTKKLSPNEQDHLFSLIRQEQIVIDLVRMNGSNLDEEIEGRYRGICW